MNSKIFTLQKHIALTLIAKLESEKLSVDQAAQISKQVLEIIPEEADDAQFESMFVTIKTIPGLQDLELQV